MDVRRLFKLLTTGDGLDDAFVTALGLPAVNTATSGDGTNPITDFVTAKYVAGPVCKIVLTLAALPIAVTDALAYASVKLLDFAEGRILVHGCTANLQWAVTTTRSTTINDSASLTWAIGTAAASNITLSSTMVDLLPKATKVLSAATTALNTAGGTALASAAQFDGTGTAKDAYLNVGFETNTDIDGDGTLTATGTITLAFSILGDY